MSEPTPLDRNTRTPSDLGEMTSWLLRLYRDLVGKTEIYTLLGVVARHLGRALGADWVWAAVVDDEGEPFFGVVRQEGSVSPRDVRALREETPALFEEVIRGTVPVWVDDTATQRGIPAEGGWQTVRSVVGFPLRPAQGVAVGAVFVGWQRPRGFDSSLAALGQALVDAAVPALAAAREHGHAHYWAQVMEAFGRAAEALTHEPDADEIARRILDQVVRALDVEAALFFAYDPERDEMRVRAAAGPAVTAEVLNRPLGAALAYQLTHRGRPIVVPDTRSTTPFIDAVDGFVTATVEAFYAIPIQVLGEPLGALLVINPHAEGMDPLILAVLSGLASLAGTALWQARLFTRLQQAHEQYRELFNDTLDWIFITNLEGWVVEANRRAKEALGFTWEALRAGTVAIEQIHALDPAVVPADLNAVPVYPPLRYESSVRLPDGKVVPVEVYLRRVHLGGVPHLQWILRDVSEAKQLETLREDLLSMVYHDLRSPLGNIVSGVDTLKFLLQQESLDRDTAQMVLGIMERATERLQRLTNNLLDIRRLEAGQPIAKPRPVSPQELIQSSVEMAHPPAEAKGQRLEVRLEEPLPLVMADPDMIRRVLMNLLENAIKYTPGEGLIEVGARSEGEWVRFWVRDTGPGIPLEEQPWIFEKYRRASTGQQAKGLGLGLAYCRLAIEAHGGTIGVHSQPGQGAEFFFSLPQAQAETDIEEDADA